MNRRLLTTLACAALMVTGWTVLAFTCEEKATAARTASTAKSTAACGFKAVNADLAHASCAGKSMKATTADVHAACAGKSMKATTADVHAACAGKSTQATTADVHAACAGKSTQATTAEFAHAECAAKPSKAANAKTANTKTANAKLSDACCATKGASARATDDCCKMGGAAMAGASRVDAVVAGGPGCSGHDMKTADRGKHGCDACADMALCDSEIRAAGGTAQAVRLKNGVMFIHTATNASHVRTIQAAMTRRSDRLAALVTAGDKAKLCPECRAMRGAMASGKLSREIVSIEGGCMTLMTSNDKSIIAKLHAMAGEEMARNKS